MKLEQFHTITFKNDAYRQKRGKPALLNILCAQCDNYIISYQKDGPGPLLRCYLDRIHSPEPLKNRQYTEFDKETAPHLQCDACKIIIGSPVIYEKENRPAYHMRQGYFINKKFINNYHRKWFFTFKK